MFNKLPYISYDIKFNNRPVIAKNIFKYSYVTDSFRNDPNNYFDHTIKSGETIESIAARYYESPSMVWVLLLYNDIRNVYEELPKGNNALTEYISDKYAPRDFINLKRLKSLPKIPKFGQYQGQIIYAEDVNNSYEWVMGTNALDPARGWNYLQQGIAKPSSRFFVVSPNNSIEPKESTRWLVSDALTDKITLESGETEELAEKIGISEINPKIVLYRGGTYTFELRTPLFEEFYFTTDSGKKWTAKDRYAGYQTDDMEFKEVQYIKDDNTITTNFQITFTVPENAPNKIYYQSDRTFSMVGEITIKDLHNEGAYVQIADKNSLYGHNGRIMGKVAKVGTDYYIWNGSKFKTTDGVFINGWDQLIGTGTKLSILRAMKTPHTFKHTLEEYEISVESYSLLPTQDRSAYTMISKYDYEHEKNEVNRKIKIMKPSLLDDFVRDWERLVK
tara:strand:+ start:335 stop:1675 length:1341 start_codon:yes stop_codon:yes gene_type:complete